MESRFVVFYFFNDGLINFDVVVAFFVSNNLLLIFFYDFDAKLNMYIYFSNNDSIMVIYLFNL
jgi:hypothetical protein